MPGLRRYAVELVAALLLTFTVLAAAAQDLVLGTLAIAAMVAVVLLAGAHANPVLTLAAVVARRMPMQDLLPCWAAQFVGALLGAALSRWLLRAPAISPLQDVALTALVAVEVLFAFALCFAVLRNDRGGLEPGPAASGRPALAAAPAAALAAGLTVVAASAVVDPVAASALNPAPAFGQVVAGITGWSTIWVYLVACPVGGALAGLAVGQASSRPG